MSTHTEFGQAEPVIEVVVREEHLGDVRKPDGAHQLSLGALATVEEDALCATAQQYGREAAVCGRQRAAGTCEEQRQIHGALRLAARSAP